MWLQRRRRADAAPIADDQVKRTFFPFSPEGKKAEIPTLSRCVAAFLGKRFAASLSRAPSSKRQSNRVTPPKHHFLRKCEMNRGPKINLTVAEKQEK